MKKSMSSLNVKKKISVKAILFGLSILASTTTCCDNRVFASNSGKTLPAIADFGYSPNAQNKLNKLINSFNQEVNKFNKEVSLQANMHSGDYPSYDKNYADICFKNLRNTERLVKEAHDKLAGNKEAHNNAQKNSEEISSYKRREKFLKKANKNFENNNTDIPCKFNYNIAEEEQNFKKEVNDLNIQASKYVDWNYEGIAKDSYWETFWD